MKITNAEPSVTGAEVPTRRLAVKTGLGYHEAMEMEQFIDDLMEERGFNEEPPEVQAQIKADLLESAERRVNAMILANIPPDDLPAFEKALDGSEEEAQAFVRKRIPDIDQKVATELLNFRIAYIG
ncbi:MAG: hypothetical protein QOE22_374 [Candidatus Parcubacteria bacterium]|jgi:hypothetical protein|nr:hypothetical protein [Candidatus Parcubacteria bacterium]